MYFLYALSAKIIIIIDFLHLLNYLNIVLDKD